MHFYKNSLMHPVGKAYENARKFEQTLSTCSSSRRSITKSLVLVIVLERKLSCHTHWRSFGHFHQFPETSDNNIVRLQRIPLKSSRATVVVVSSLFLRSVTVTTRISGTVEPVQCIHAPTPPVCWRRAETRSISLRALPTAAPAPRLRSGSRPNPQQAPILHRQLKSPLNRLSPLNIPTRFEKTSSWRRPLP